MVRRFWRTALGVLLLASVLVGVPSHAFGAGARAAAVKGSGTWPNCVDGRPGPAPVIDHRGKVGVPRVYCYNPHGNNAGWHDFCSAGQGDTWSKAGIVVSFEGPCAYHDLCLEYGWGRWRESCDVMFRAYMHRNCAATIRHSSVPDFLEGWIVQRCTSKADRMYLGVALYTAITSWSDNSYRRGTWRCYVESSFGSVYCTGLAGGSGDGGSWRSR